jgi:hypothetical protein
MAGLLFIVCLAAIIGIIKPYIPRARRWHFAMVAAISFVSIGAFAPKLPEKHSTEGNASSSSTIVPPRPTQDAAHADSSSDQRPSALDQMEVAFKGHHPREELERKTATILRLYDQNLTEDNYRALGDILVFLQKKIDPHTEFDLMDCLIDTGRANTVSKFGLKEAAALCATEINSGIVG